MAGRDPDCYYRKAERKEAVAKMTNDNMPNADLEELNELMTEIPIVGTHELELTQDFLAEILTAYTDPDLPVVKYALKLFNAIKAELTRRGV
jgi:hypothetical protein